MTPELDGLVSPITSLVINTVKRDLQNLVTPLLREMLEEQIKNNAPSDVSELFGRISPLAWVFQHKHC